jgi:hypothetical protein
MPSFAAKKTLAELHGMKTAEGRGRAMPADGISRKTSTASCCTQYLAPSNRWKPTIRVQALLRILHTVPED